MRKTILLIVDDWEVLERIEDSLAPHFDLLSAPFGKEGLEVAQEKVPHHIVLDLTFENMTNDEALLALKSSAATASIPVTVLRRDSSQEGVSIGKLVEGLRLAYEIAESN